MIESAVRFFGRGEVPGVIVHNPAGVRRTLIGLGAAAAVGGGVSTYLGVQNDHDVAKISGIAAATTGVVLAGVGKFRFAPRFAPYMNGKVYGGVDDALEAAAKVSQDVGVHKTEKGNFGLLDLKKFDVDNRGPGSVDIGNQWVSLDYIRTRDGDVHKAVGKTYVNTGVRPQEAIDLTREVALTPELEGRLLNARLGTDSNHLSLMLGSRVSPTEGFASKDLAEQWGFEQGTKPFATLNVGDKWHAFSVHGADVTTVKARGRTVLDMKALSVVGELNSHVARGPGESYAAQRIARIDTAGMSASEVRNLEGHRLAGLWNDDVARVGKLVDEFPSRPKAESALFDRGGEYLTVEHDGKTLVYEMDRSAINREPGSLLGPDSTVRLFRGSHSRGIMDRSLQRMAFSDTRQIPIAKAKTLEGERLAGYNEPYSRVGALVETHSDLSVANRAAHDSGREQLVLPLQGGYARFDITGGSPRQLESASRLGPDSAVRTVVERKTYAPDGPSWEFAGRSVPFETWEPIGHDLFGVGAASNYRGQVSGGDAGRSFIVNNSRRHAPLGAVHGNGNEVHIYDLRGSGSRWDDELGRAEGAARVNWDERIEYHDRDVPPYPHEQWHRAWVERLDLEREWVDLYTHSGRSTRRDTGWYIEHRSHDSSRTWDLQSRLRNTYENWKNSQPKKP